MTEEELPADVRRLWRMPEDGRLGRRPELDVDRVVRTAVELADRDGLNGVTLAKVAAPLGVTAMSLYRYVGSKEELFALMWDFASGPAPESSGTAATWRSGLRQWALALREAYARHPWMAELALHGPPRGPHAIGWMDAALRILRGTGLDWGAKLGIQVLVSGFVRQAGEMSRQMAEGRRGTGLDQAASEQAYGNLMARLVDPDRFPDAARLFASDVFAHTAPPEGEGTGDPDFDFGLELILDGVEAAIHAAPRSAPGPA